ncbi:MAG TPA: VOC family protein [Rhodopila sp.]
MHRSRLCALLIDCKTSDVDEAARFWAKAVGRPVDLKHWGSRSNYRMLETPPGDVQIQRVEHDSRAHLDIETDDISAEVARLEKLGAGLVERAERWVVMQASTGQRRPRSDHDFCANRSLQTKCDGSRSPDARS